MGPTREIVYFIQENYNYLNNLSVIIMYLDRSGMQMW